MRGTRYINLLVLLLFPLTNGNDPSVVMSDDYKIVMKEMLNLLSNYKDHIMEISGMRTCKGTMIKGYQLHDRQSDHNTKNAIFIEAGIYGYDQVSTMAAVLIIKNLLKLKSHPTSLLRYYDFIIIPIANPDQFGLTPVNKKHQYKIRRCKNHLPTDETTVCESVDFTLNYPFQFGNSSHIPKYSQCGPNYPGEKPFTIIEAENTKSTMNHYFGNIKGYISLNSGGNSILYPYAYQFNLTENWRELHYIAAMAAHNVHMNNGRHYEADSYSLATLEEVGGTSIDFMYASGVQFAAYVLIPGPISFRGYRTIYSDIKPEDAASDAWIIINTITMFLKETDWPAGPTKNIN